MKTIAIPELKFTDSTKLYAGLNNTNRLSKKSSSLTNAVSQCNTVILKMIDKHTQ